MEHIATIKHTLTTPIKNVLGTAPILPLSQKQLEHKRTYSGTFGIPMYITTKSSKQDCSVKKDLTANPPLCVGANVGMSSALRPQSPSELFHTLLDENK